MTVKSTSFEVFFRHVKEKGYYILHKAGINGDFEFKKVNEFGRETSCNTIIKTRRYQGMIRIKRSESHLETDNH